ncbi:MAG: hypothetical protein HYY24_07600 [Verrucomicrobia bacterium]|nr:hypothetical protein [Verrucomicrobiota bacterium]
MRTITLSVVDRARAYVAAIPGAVSGASGHNQTFSVACALVHGFALPKYEALALLREYNQRCQPPWTERELQHKIKSALLACHAKPRGHLLGAAGLAFDRNAFSTLPRPKEAPPVKIDPTTATENFLKGFRCGEVDLWEASAIRPPDDWTKDALALLAFLFEPGELVNFVSAFVLDRDGRAKPKGRGETVERDALLAHWRNGGMPRTDAGGWLRMNPMDGQGVADANVTVFRFALIECDAVPLDLQMPLLAKLPLPIAAILTSGGRSLHAWVKVDADSLDDYRQTVARLLTLLAKFGVDGKNKNPSRLSRLPGVVRRIGADGDGRQRLLYLNPEPEQRAIL